MIPIYIPTFMREERQIAYNAFGLEARSHVTLCTHDGRADELRRCNLGAKVEDLGHCEGVAEVRTKICDLARANGHRFIMMMDDGATLCKSYITPDGKRKLHPVVRGDKGDPLVFELVETVESLLWEYPLVGISPRPGNNRHLPSLAVPSRVYSVFGVDLDALEANDITFDGMQKRYPGAKVMEDFWVVLSLLTIGLPVALNYDYAFHQQHGRPGGCATYRTSKVQETAVRALNTHFPKYTKIVMKDNVSWGIDGEAQRYECHIQWKKALTDAQSLL